MKTQISNKTAGILGAFLLTFGISYFDFDNVMNEANIKPALMMFLGVVTVGYFFFFKRNSQD